MNKTLRLLAAGLALGLGFAAHAQQWPDKPVRMVNPFPAGGGTDAFARPLAAQLGKQLGQQVYIDNRGGAGGTVGAEIAAKAPADGYTFFMGAIHHTIAVSLYKRLGYDLEKDFVPITVVAYVPNVVVVNPQKVPVNTLGELVAHIKKNPGKLNYGSAGNGTSHHLAGELFKTLTQTYITHIPYRGAGLALQDLLGGQVDLMFDGLGSSAAHIKSGKLKPLAVTTAKRSPLLPNVPTVQEAGVPGYEVTTWYALWAVKGTPREITAKMHAEVVKALASKEVRDAWAAQGADAGGNSPEQFAAFIKTEIAKWAKVVKDSGAQLD